ncbi:MAG: class I SAM-dependent methyltransferase [Kiritimatiellae bacterium]|nr:class I SAM-dependent methyltransferase [Kiritimatiellia bacterium]
MPDNACGRLRLGRWLARLARRCVRRRYFNRTVAMREDPAAREGLRDMIDWWGDARNLVMVEIGSYSGESAEIFLASGKVAKLYCVDPWRMDYDPNDVAAFTDMERIERIFDDRFAGETRMFKVKGTIDDMAARLETHPEKVDVVYVDGCHTYEAVRHDLTVALSMIRPRLFICGHDYSDEWEGAKRAVEEVVGAPDAIFRDTSWGKRLA